MTKPSRKLERQHPGPVVGVDEAGRGPLAGPVVAAAVVLPEQGVPRGIDDSKKLTAHTRAELHDRLIRIALGHAEIESAKSNSDQLRQAIADLTIAQREEPRSTLVHRLLATAYGQTGDESRAKLHLAEEALLQGRYDYAKGQAESAKNGLKQGSPDWIRVNDILLYVQTRKENDDDNDSPSNFRLSR